MNEAATTDTVIEAITAEGMDYHNFKCEAAAKNYNLDAKLGRGNLWLAIAEMTRRTTDAEWARVWELAGVPIPEWYDEAA